MWLCAHGVAGTEGVRWRGTAHAGMAYSLSAARYLEVVRISHAVHPELTLAVILMYAARLGCK